MKIAYIMRGVPGSGKSTLAKTLASDNGAIHSTDDFFYVDGEYRFDGEKLREYHERNFEAFCNSLRNGVQAVVLDNTNTRYWHFERYVVAAQQAGYRIAFVVMPHPTPEIAAQRTLHKVPVHAIQRMIEEWGKMTRLQDPRTSCAGGFLIYNHSMNIVNNANDCRWF